MRRSILLAIVFGFSLLDLNAIAQQSESAQGQNQDQNQDQNKDQVAAAQHQEQSVDTQSARSFEGKIVKSGSSNGKDKFILRDSATREPYGLDNQVKAKEFEGKNVKVTATVDPYSNVLHVVDITRVEK